jgi:hypothetical protein
MARQRFWRQQIADNKPLPCTTSHIRRRSKMFLEQADRRIVAYIELRDGSEVNSHVFFCSFLFVVHFCLPYIGVERKPSNADGGVPVINKSAVDILFTVA